MLIRLKQATELAGKDYGLGVHDVPAEAMKDKNYKYLVNADLLEVVGEAPKPAVSLQEENAILAKRLAAEGAFKLGEGGTIDESEAPTMDSAPSTSAGASDADEKKDSSKSKSKGK